MNCLLKALAMSLGLMCVLSFNVMELLSCCGGRLWASPCSVPVGACVSSVVPWVFYVFLPDVCLVYAYEGGDLLVKLRYTGILWRVFACQVSVCYFVANGLW